MKPLETIAAGLDEMSSKGGSSTFIDSTNLWCVTFEARDSTTEGDPFWIQVNAGTLNMQYLDEDAPMPRLLEEVDAFPNSFRQIAWDARLYATFEMPTEYSSCLASLIDRINRQYFALQTNYEIGYRAEYMGG